MMPIFDKTPEAEPPAQLELHHCPEETCSSKLVQLTDCEPIGFKDWYVDRHCPNCEWSGQGVCDESAIDRFEEASNEGLRAIIRKRDVLSRANMEEYADRFASALRAGQILPEDFDSV
ncbi:MAG: hypothetical protein WA843_02630 [Candidatus Saccharimonadales bacterium]